MSKITQYGFVLILVLSLVAVMPAYAEQLVVTLDSQRLSVHDAAEDSLGDYCTLSIPVPAVLTGKELLGAYLEFYVDVDTRQVGDVDDKAPRLDIIALTDTYEGTVDEEKFGVAANPPGIVLVGEGRRVLRDITSIVQRYLDNSESNHGLILGSLMGEREGLFTIKTGVLGEGVVARLIVHFRDSWSGSF